MLPGEDHRPRTSRGRGMRAAAFSISGFLFAGVILGSGSHPLWAATRISARSGYWKQQSTWTGGVVPGPADEVVIAAGHTIQFDGPENPLGNCARLTIQAGGFLQFARKVMTFLVGGDGPGVRGGIEISGAMEVPGGVTIAVDPDGNALSEEDGVTVHPGGSLTLQGNVVYEGTVSSVLADDDSRIDFTDPALHLGQKAEPLRIVWRSGQRKGRWYDILSTATGEMILDPRSRSNAERLGEPDYKAGAAVVQSQDWTVTGVGTRWTDETAAGSWFWCDADGPDRKVRVRKVISATSLQLARAYGPSACSVPGPYTLRDENQPYPAVDVSERITAGDRYSVLLPAVLRSLHGSDDNFDEQIFVRVEAGATYHFENASFESVGKEAWESGAGSGLRITGFQGGVPPAGIFNTVEIYRYAGEAGIEWDDSKNLDVDWLFLHWAHPLITTSNEGHGVKIKHTTAGQSADNVRIRNARFDRTNDDFVWWASTAGGTSGVYDSIGKYCPNTASGDSCDGVDTNDELGITGGQLRIERNLFANIGAKMGGSCMSAALGRNTAQPGWKGDGWVARDNVCLNLQSVPCILAVGPGATWSRESIWAVNNVCVNVFSEGIFDIPHVFQNEVINFGMQRRSSSDGVRGVYVARGNVIWGVGSGEASDSYVLRGASVGFNLETEANWTGGSWSLTDNVIIVSGSGMLAGSWSSALHPAVGDAEVRHNTILGNLSGFRVGYFSGVLDFHDEPAGAAILITDNIFDLIVPAGSEAGQGFSATSSVDRIDRNVVHTSYFPFWGGFFSSTNDFMVSTGISPALRILGPQPWSGAWSVATTDGDRPGPRFAGTLLQRLPFQVPGLIAPVDTDPQDLDRDGDGLIDRWDNCPDVSNPGWADSDGNGIGDACQP
jgi:hypothetical protein